jgi:hypothetical protein
MPRTVTASDPEALRILLSHQHDLHLRSASEAEQTACALVIEKTKRWLASDRSGQPPSFVLKTRAFDRAASTPTEAEQAQRAQEREAARAAMKAQRIELVPRTEPDLVVLLPSGEKVALYVSGIEEWEMREIAVEKAAWLVRFMIQAVTSRPSERLHQNATLEIGHCLTELRRVGAIREAA